MVDVEQGTLGVLLQRQQKDLVVALWLLLLGHLAGAESGVVLETIMRFKSVTEEILLQLSVFEFTLESGDEGPEQRLTRQCSWWKTSSWTIGCLKSPRRTPSVAFGSLLASCTEIEERMPASTSIN